MELTFLMFVGYTILSDVCKYLAEIVEGVFENSLRIFEVTPLEYSQSEVSC